MSLLLIVLDRRVTVSQSIWRHTCHCLPTVVLDIYQFPITYKPKTVYFCSAVRETILFALIIFIKYLWDDLSSLLSRKYEIFF